MQGGRGAQGVPMKLKNGEYKRGKGGSIPSLSPVCTTGKEGVFLERFHHKEANFSRSQVDEIGHVCIREEFEICTAAW